MHNGEPFAEISLQVPGLHNVKNALAAAAAAIALGISAQAVSEGLSSFRGAGRRFEYQGTINGADVYDDYAHHPSEVGALLDAAKELGYKRILCAFQPHTYSRTKALFDDFVKVLAMADVTLLTDIYAAREQNTIGISSKDLADRIPGAEYLPTLSDTEARLRQLAQPGDLILTVGAGDICNVGYQLVK
jgi:UDP-N-acetylmuramate--alanine ligase